MSNTRLDPATRKAQLLDVALALAEKGSYKTITREEVASTAGVSTGLVSKYFGTMPNLADEVVGLAITRKVSKVIAEAMVDKHPRIKQLRKAKRDDIRDVVDAFLSE